MASSQSPRWSLGDLPDVLLAGALDYSDLGEVAACAAASLQLRDGLRRVAPALQRRRELSCDAMLGRVVKSQCCIGSRTQLEALVWRGSPSSAARSSRMRQPILWLLAAIVVSAQQSPQEASRARFQKNTLAAIDAWLGGGAPPGPWRVTSPSNVTDVKHPLQRHGIVKAISSGRVGDLQVVVKRARRDAKPKRRDAEKRAHALALAHAKDELAFLEGLRGRRGVPLLLGGWLERGLPTLVVADAGRSLAAGRTVTANGASAGDSRKLNIDGGYAALARAEPLALAVAILECFESFAGVGGLFLEDFRSDQFAYAADPVSFALVDGPRPLDDDRPRRWTARSDAPRPCAADADCPPTHAYHCCCRGVSRDDRGCAAAAGPCHCDANTTAAPEAAGLCRRGTCAPITAKTHAFDVAARSYLLPLALDHLSGAAAAAAARLLADMRAADPDDRPSFADALARLRSLR